MSDEKLLLGQIDGKVDIILEHVKDHNMRITSLETDRNHAKGALFGIATVSGGVGAYLTKLLGWN